MVEAILAANGTWFAPTVSSVTRESITEIEIRDSYIPDASVTVTDSWDASAAKDSSVMCYVIGTKLIIAGNGGGKVFINQESQKTFGDIDGAESFINVTTFTNATLLDPSKCINMFGLFGSMRSLTSLDISNWNIANATILNQMFGFCESLTDINVSGLQIPNVAHFSYLFRGCKKLNV